MDVTVAHYPPGASKWNSIEHRLFSEISKNWAGRPLDSYETTYGEFFAKDTKAEMIYIGGGAGTVTCFPT